MSIFVTSSALDTYIDDKASLMLMMLYQRRFPIWFASVAWEYVGILVNYNSAGQAMFFGRLCMTSCTIKDTFHEFRLVDTDSTNRPAVEQSPPS